MATFFDIHKAVLPELQECCDCQKLLFAIGDTADSQEKTQGGGGGEWDDRVPGFAT